MRYVGAATKGATSNGLGMSGAAGIINPHGYRGATWACPGTQHTGTRLVADGDQTPVSPGARAARRDTGSARAVHRHSDLEVTVAGDEPTPKIGV